MCHNSLHLKNMVKCNLDMYGWLVSELEKKVPSFLVKGAFPAVTWPSYTDMHMLPEASRAAVKELNSSQVYKSRKLK